MALMGVNKETADPFKRGFTSVPLPSAGLLDLAFFRALNEAKDGGTVTCVAKIFCFYIYFNYC